MAYTVVDFPAEYFNTKLYTGTGATQSITGVGFQPDWVWTKSRSNAGYNHQVHDVIRGANKVLWTNLTNAEGSADTNGFLSFQSDGFNLGADTVYTEVNVSGQTYASWNWLANGTGVSNTSGSITSTVSANTTSGFSVCTYTGDGGTTTSSTIGHGLGVAPKIYFLKGRSEAGDWIVASSMFTNLQFLKLNLTNALASGGTAQYVMNSSTISVPARNTSGQTYVAYCFAEVKGFSKFGSYTGNGSTDGTFIYTGFTPAFVMFKRTDSADQWTMMDNKRATFNVMKGRLYAESSSAEETTYNVIDFCSNGIKLRLNGGDTNGSGGSYIYMCFASSPFVSSKGIPTTAR